MSKIDADPFFTNWSGHPIASLQTALSLIQHSRPSAPIIYFAGDSSLDNKAWVPAPTQSYRAPHFPTAGLTGDSSTAAQKQQRTSRPAKPLPVPVPEIYSTFLEQPLPKPDVAFWLNHHLESEPAFSAGGSSSSTSAAVVPTCLNTAIEATLLRHRDGELLPQDVFIRDSITARDVLIVSVGANDIALAPNLGTILNMAKLAHLTSRRSIEEGSAWGLGHFRDLFGRKTQRYIERLVEKEKPRAVVICMIYFPLENVGGGGEPERGWAETQLKLLGYNSKPEQLQAAIAEIFRSATSQIKIQGTRVIPCALYEVLDCKDAKDYVERVEPGVEGGRKMGRRFCEIVKSVLDGEGGDKAKTR